MDLYAEDLADYIYQENNVDKKRALLLEVEAEIKKVLSSNPPLYRPYMEEVRQQLLKRTVLLN